MFSCVQTILNDLKSMKVQIDAIVTKSETLKSESNSEQYNQRLTDNGMNDDLTVCCIPFVKLPVSQTWQSDAHFVKHTPVLQLSKLCPGLAR